MTKRIEVEDLAETVGPTLDAFVSGAAPHLRKCAEAVYEELLYSVQDYLRENAEWNIGGEIERCRKTEAENRDLRAQLEPFAGYNPAALAALVEAGENAVKMRSVFSLQALDAALTAFREGSAS